MNKMLKDQALLEDLSGAELTRISRIVRRLKFKKGEQIFKEKEDTKGLYLINSGKVEISKVTPDGWKQTLAVFTGGHFFGELSILEKRRHEAVAVAVENTDMLLIGKEDFERLEREDVALAFKIMKKMTLVMCKNLRRMNDKFLNALISY
ncbi:MAG: cyclic nucleotide-binding domain-containing protein [Nitrospiraceae bacterium]|nr:cyclic nucleotide-binding domain-containing protein [Nitrospiraceae bacterium]